MIVGGLGSMTGALMGGLLIGVSEAVAGLLIEPSLKSMFSFGLLILVLLLRPQGLFGRQEQLMSGIRLPAHAVGCWACCSRSCSWRRRCSASTASPS